MKSIHPRRGLAVLCLLASCLAFSSAAIAQGTPDFTLSASPFNPDAVAPTGTSSATIQIGSTSSGYTGTVNLSCQVTSQQTATDAPICLISPSSVTVPGSATATITTKLDTSTIPYSITITGTSPATTITTPPLSLTVLALPPQFTISVTSAVAPTSVPAGNGAQGTITINPISGYSSPAGGVTLACSSISPLVTIAPVCTFAYPSGQRVNGAPVSATLTISTFGPVTTGEARRSGTVYAFWFSLPLFGLVGLVAVANNKRSRKARGLLTLLMLGGFLILVPACGNNSTSTTTPNGVTPANTYTFTIIGVDSAGTVSSNTGTSTTGPTVTLTVTAPAKKP